MDDRLFYHFVRMVIASAICTGMIGFGLFGRRRDRSRRWLFVAGGVLCSLMTAITIIANSNGFPRDSSSTLGFVIAAALLLPAVAFMVGGWKGRRTGDHPYCRKCGFDLFGKPEQSTRCGECGSDLELPKAVVTGIHQVRRGWVLAGIFCLILGLMIGGETGREFIVDFDFNQYKPTWWLLRDLDSQAQSNNAAIALGAELASVNLSQAHAQQIAERVLKDLESGKINPLIGSLIQLIDRRDLLDEKTTRRIMKQVGCLGRLIMPPTLVRDRPIPFVEILPAGRFTPDKMRYAISTVNLDCRLTSANYHLGDLLVSENMMKPVPLWNDFFENGNQRSIDLAGNWQKISGRRTTLSVAGTLVVTLNYHGATISEALRYSQQSSEFILTAEEAALPLLEPTEDELSEVWSATVFTGGPTARIRLERAHSGSHVFARAALIDSRSRREIGLASVGYQNTGVIWLDASIQIPQGDFKLELVPAPLLGGSNWDRSAILNQTITITSINRSAEIMPPEQ